MLYCPFLQSVACNLLLPERLKCFGCSAPASSAVGLVMRRGQATLYSSLVPDPHNKPRPVHLLFWPPPLHRRRVGREGKRSHRHPGTDFVIAVSRYSLGPCRHYLLRDGANPKYFQEATWLTKNNSFARRTAKVVALHPRLDESGSCAGSQH